MEAQASTSHISRRWRKSFAQDHAWSWVLKKIPLKPKNTEYKQSQVLLPGHTNTPIAVIWSKSHFWISTQFTPCLSDKTALDNWMWKEKKSYLPEANFFTPLSVAPFLKGLVLKDTKRSDISIASSSKYMQVFSPDLIWGIKNYLSPISFHPLVSRIREAVCSDWQGLNGKLFNCGREGFKQALR